MSKILSVVVAEVTKRRLQRRAAETGLTVSELTRFGVAGVLDGTVDLRPDGARQSLIEPRCKSAATQTKTSSAVKSKEGSNGSQSD